MADFNFYKDRKVLVTGHTGFKGSWLCMILNYLGANVTGYALIPPTVPSLFEILKISDKIDSRIGDIRDIDKLMQVFVEVKPEIVIHMAAQPLVRESYAKPVYTYETNVMGTVNVLECIRKSGTVKSFVNVTTDKVYENRECTQGYKETDRLDGFDPYSNSKSCSELVTHCYSQSFLDGMGVAVSTCRAGNVIGGGDFAMDRIIPDCVRAAGRNETIAVRNPFSIRPFQHVIEPLFAYLLVAMEQYRDIGKAGNYNVGPEETNCITAGDLVDLFCEKWGEGAVWEDKSDNGPHEAGLLRLDIEKMKSTFSWSPKWNIEQTMERVVEWEKVYRDKQDVEQIMVNQIAEYEE